MLKVSRRHFDLAILALVIAAFAVVAAQHIGTVPVPEGDEAFTLQVPYEMLYRGRLALPMLRYLGGNIENVWHSFTPVYFIILSGFFKLFGFGLTEGRVFNLITAITTLLMIYLIGRRLFDWRAGLIAVVMLVGDQTFLERSRLLRNDYAAATFALLAFYLYEIAEERKSARFYIGAGLAAGAGVMCHTNILYMLAAIGLLILLRDGWRAFVSRKLYLFATSAFVVMAYEIIYDLIDYKNFGLQNRGDDLHFRILEPQGWWQNILDERLRYQKWYTGGVLFSGLPQVTLRVFQALTVVAIIYLIIVCARQIKRRRLLAEPRARVLLVMLVVVLFHAVVVSHKRIYYMAHLAPWFALGVGILLGDAVNQLGRLRMAEWPRARLVYKAAVIMVGLLMAGYAFQLARQQSRFIVEARNPDLASFAELTEVLRKTIPAELCPVAVQNPSIWLAFPESDRCFATLEKRMQNDIDGKDYALVKRAKHGTESAETSGDGYHLLGVLNNTAYGDLVIYYTGTDPRYLALKPRQYRFFGEQGGYLSDEQVSAAGLNKR
jgi:4-amino-4-deoxy-L-arabinose transferase-like glycosyltransferase